MIGKIKRPIVFVPTEQLQRNYDLLTSAEEFAYKQGDFDRFHAIREAANDAANELKARGEW